MLSVSLACSISGSSSEQEGIHSTQTVLMQTSQALETAAAKPTDTTFTLETETPEPTLTPNDTLPSPTQTTETQAASQTETPSDSGLPTITANVNTNCREQPSQDFKIVGYLLKGQTSSVLATEPSGNWWQIENPDRPPDTCWVWAETTSISGDTSGVAVKEPPPMPDALVGVGFHSLVTCGADVALNFVVSNASHVELKSLGMVIEDITTGDTIFGPYQRNSPFMSSSSDCPPGASTLPAAASGYVGGILDSLSLPGANLRASIKLCAEENLQGACADQIIQFVMPAP